VNRAALFAEIPSLQYLTVVDITAQYAGTKCLSVCQLHEHDSVRIS